MILTSIIIAIILIMGGCGIAHSYSNHYASMPSESTVLSTEEIKLTSDESLPDYIPTVISATALVDDTEGNYIEDSDLFFVTLTNEDATGTPIENTFSVSGMPYKVNRFRMSIIFNNSDSISNVGCTITYDAGSPELENIVNFLDGPVDLDAPTDVRQITIELMVYPQDSLSYESYEIIIEHKAASTDANLKSGELRIVSDEGKILCKGFSGTQLSMLYALPYNSTGFSVTAEPNDPLVNKVTIKINNQIKSHQTIEYDVDPTNLDNALYKSLTFTIKITVEAEGGNTKTYTGALHKLAADDTQTFTIKDATAYYLDRNGQEQTKTFTLSELGEDENIEEAERVEESENSIKIFGTDADNTIPCSTYKIVFKIRPDSSSALVYIDSLEGTLDENGYYVFEYDDISFSQSQRSERKRLLIKTEKFQSLRPNSRISGGGEYWLEFTTANSYTESCTFEIGGHCKYCGAQAELYWGADIDMDEESITLTLSSFQTDATPNKYSADSKWDPSYIISVTVDTYAYAGQSTSKWFYNCDGLRNVDLSKLDTSDVTDMSSMFDGCNGLTSLDLSNFDTSKVTNMSYMFEHCSGLTSLGVSNFDTSKVTNMSYMFESCGGLTSLDLSAFNTSSVTNMAGMFSACASLTSLDLTNFDTSNVTNMNAMFHGCETLTSLDVTSFDTSNVSNMALTFNWCASLTSLDVSNFNTSKVTTMSGMFNCCSALTSLDVSNFNTSSVTDMSGMFSVCSGLTSLDLSHFNTVGVKDMESMFYGCGDLTSLDLHSFNTSSVTNAELMFEFCESLKEIRAPQTIGAEPLSFPYNDERWWNDTRKIEITQYITSDDAGHTLYLHNNHNYGDWKYQVLSNCTQTGIKEHKDCTICKLHFDFFGNEIEDLTIDIAPGSHVYDEGVVTKQPTCTEEGERTFTCTLNSSHAVRIEPIDMLEHQYEMGGHCKVCGALAELYWGVMDGVLTLSSYQTDATPNNYSDSKWNTDITSVTVDTYAYAGQSTANWFFNCGQLTSVDLSNLDTSGVTDMSDMFALCKSITQLDVSSLNTSKVTNMTETFAHCLSLTTLNLSSFNTEAVTSMQFMFHNCTGLTSLDVTNFDTSSVTSMTDMFTACSSLKNLDLSKFNTQNVTTMAGMFSGDVSLTTLDVSNFDTAKVTNMGIMFYNCKKLSSVNLSSFDTSKVTNMRGMFANCSSLTSLDLSNFDISKVTDMDNMFYDCANLNEIRTPKTIGSISLPLPDEDKWWNGEKDITEFITSADAGKTIYRHATHNPLDAVRENEVSATCMKEGSYDEVFYCSICKAEISRTHKTIDIDSDNHAWNDGEVTAAPTCTDKGEKTFTCAHNSQHKKTEELDALGHDYGEWTVDKEPTVDEEGEEHRVCSRDDTHIEIRAIQKLDPPIPWALVIAAAVFDIVALCVALAIMNSSKRKSK